MKINLFATFTALVLFAVSTPAAEMPKVGDTAPLFVGQDQDGKTVKLADLIGKKSCCCISIRRISPAAAQRRRVISATAWAN